MNGLSDATMTGTATTSIELPAERGSPASAREFVSRILRKNHVAPETVDIARLLTSELVTNSVVHARTAVVVSVRITERRVHIAVADDDESGLPPDTGADLDTHGRGLTIVARLARDWGVDRRSDGKSVWFELRTTRG